MAVMKEVSDIIVRNGKEWFVDREDINTGKQVTSPGETVTWTFKHKEYVGVVSDEAVGRDDDCYKVNVITLTNRM